MTRFAHLGSRLGLEPKAIAARVGCSTNRAPTNREALIPRPDPPRMKPPLAVVRWANGDGSSPSHCRRRPRWPSGHLRGGWSATVSPSTCWPTATLRWNAQRPAPPGARGGSGRRLRHHHPEPPGAAGPKRGDQGAVSERARLAQPLRAAEPLRGARGQRPLARPAGASRPADGLRDLERAGQGEEVEQRDHSQCGQVAGPGRRSGAIAGVQRWGRPLRRPLRLHPAAGSPSAPTTDTPAALAPMGRSPAGEATPMATGPSTASPGPASRPSGRSSRCAS